MENFFVHEPKLGKSFKDVKQVQSKGREIEQIGKVTNIRLKRQQKEMEIRKKLKTSKNNTKIQQINWGNFSVIRSMLDPRPNNKIQL